jgi:hypothetical protein
VDQEGKGLSPGSAFVKVRPLSTERVRRDHLLRLEARIADRAAQFDLLKRRHDSVSPSDFVRRSSSPVAKENFVPSARVSQDGNLRAVHDARFATDGCAPYVSLVPPTGRRYHTASNAPTMRRSRR